MKVEAVNPKTGATISSNVPEEQAAALQELGKERIGEKKLRSYLDGLGLSEDNKVIINELSDVALTVGGQSIKLGRRIVDIAVVLQIQFPRATFGLIVGLVVSILITAIPILGSVLGGIITPIAVAAGVGLGFVADIQNNKLYRKITDATALFDPLKPSLSDARQAYDQLLRNLSLQS